MCSKCTNVHAGYCGWIVFFNLRIQWRYRLQSVAIYGSLGQTDEEVNCCKRPQGAQIYVQTTVKCTNSDLQRTSQLAVVSFVACDGLRSRGATWKRGGLRKNPLSYIISGSVCCWYWFCLGSIAQWQVGNREDGPDSDTRSGLLDSWWRTSPDIWPGGEIRKFRN